MPMPGGGRLGVDPVAELGVAEQEAALERDVHVVEDDDGVHLLEAPAERAVEVRRAVVERLAADEAEARRVARDRERERVRSILLGALEHGRGHHEQLVGNRPDRRQHARAADHDAVVVLADDLRAERAAELLRGVLAAVGLGRDQRVRGEQILLPHQLVVAPHVVGERRVGLREPAARLAERHQAAVEVVAGAPERA
jgi:hypothetical protein